MRKQWIPGPQGLGTRLGFIMFITASAVANRDYSTTSMMLMFPPGRSTSPIDDSNIVCMNIAIYDDDELEQNRTFSVTLTSSHPHLGNDLTIVTIVDDDG